MTPAQLSAYVQACYEVEEPKNHGFEVINFDMPKEIENYVHRIGRTGSHFRVSIS